MKNKFVVYAMIFLALAFSIFFTKIVFYPPANTVFNLTNIRSFLELISFISSPLLLITAFFGLKQLQYAQEEIETTQKVFRTQSTRDAYEASIRECRNFSEKVFPLTKKINQFVKENNITYFNDAIIEEDENGFKVNFSKANREQLTKFLEIEETIRDYMNNMELFSLYFVNRIADENIAFLSLGKLYVKEVERLAKLLPLTNGTPDDCKAIWTLYFSWKDRIKKQKLEKEISKMDEERNNKDKQLKNITVTDLKAIGTE